jgi:gamma-butyrobetaine dioxygenase/trimethyllysine dioxygenase
MPGVEPRRDHLRVHFGAGPPHHADFHYFWLRHWCGCCRHPVTGERTLCGSRVALDLRPARVALDEAGEAVEIDWSEAGGVHRSRYALSWLARNAYAADRSEVPPPRAELSRIDLGELHESGAALAKRCIERVERHGAAVVRGAGDDTEALIAGFEGEGLQVTETHFGRIEDLRTDNTTNRNTDQLGYTDAPVDLHTDQPFIARPPRLQMLHCMRPAEQGGENALADARAAASHLRSIDAHAFELLSTVPVRFHRVQRDFESLEERPILTLGEDGELAQVRLSYFSYAPHRLPFAQMEAFYRAYRHFAALVSDPANQYRFALSSGDFALYDNFRMLHARTGFRGSRWVRGVYFDALPPAA